jgi:hypothetical protein
MSGQTPGFEVLSIELPGAGTPVDPDTADGRRAWTEQDVSEVTSLYVAEMVTYGTGAGEVQIALGDQQRFFRISPGDFIGGFRPVRKIRFRNMTDVPKRLVLWVSNEPTFRAWNTPRGL